MVNTLAAIIILSCSLVHFSLFSGSEPKLSSDPGLNCIPALHLSYHTLSSGLVLLDEKGIYILGSRVHSLDSDS